MKKTLLFSFKQTVPILFGYLFLGVAFGMLMSRAGYNALWCFFSALLVYAGSMQFVMVSLLASGAPLLTVAVMTLLINGRHIFYGLGFIETFRGMGKRYPYMVLSLTDETFSVLSALKTPEGMDRKKAMFFIALLNHAYWVLGCTAGGLIGGALPFDFSGIEFSMTALFIVIFIEQWKQYKTRLPALIGLSCAAAFLLLLGPERFLLPALTASVLLLFAFKSPIGEKLGANV